MSFMDTLKRDWQATDFYNFEDLNRVDLATRYLNERIFDYRGTRLTLDLPPNLIPYPSDPTYYMMWYANGTITAKGFKSGRQGFRAELTNFGASPNLRVANGSTATATTNITKGKGYIFTVIFKASPELSTVEHLGIYYERNVPTPYWVDFNNIPLEDCPVESLKDDTRRLDIHFIAQDTAGVRASFGFGANNPALKNGSYVDVVEFRIEEARTEKTIEFASGFNRVESNIAELKTYLRNPIGTIEPKTDWAQNQAFTYTDANRLEENLYSMYQFFIKNATNIPYCGMYTVGQQGVY